MIYIYPYNPYSESVSTLKNILGAKGIKVSGSKFRGSPVKKVVNWGSSVINTEVEKSDCLNPPSVLKEVNTKTKFFTKVQGKSRVPEFTKSVEEAFGWLESSDVVCRSLEQGHSGEGIHLVSCSDSTMWNNMDHNEIKFYTRYVKKRDEYRVHIFRGKIIDVQKKGVPKGGKVNDYKIRTHRFGFIYMREGFETPKDVLNQAILAFNASGLDFGAFDVIYNAYRDEATVLEANTAPGLMGSTGGLYADQISKHFGGTGVDIPQKEGYAQPTIKGGIPKYNKLDDLLMTVDWEIDPPQGD